MYYIFRLLRTYVDEATVVCGRRLTTGIDGSVWHTMNFLKAGRAEGDVGTMRNIRMPQKRGGGYHERNKAFFSSSTKVK